MEFNKMRLIMKQNLKELREAQEEPDWSVQSWRRRNKPVWNWNQTVWAKRDLSRVWREELMEHMGDDLNFLCVVGSNDVCWGGAVMGEVFEEWIDLKLMGMGPRGPAEECWIHHIQNVPSFRAAGFSLTEVLFLMNLWLTWVLFSIMGLS